MIDLALTDNNTKEFEQTMSQDLDKVIEHFDRELITIRTGRAHPALVENIKVLCYGGSTMEIKKIAAIAAPESNLITIEPWDKSIINDIEKAISQSDLGVTPENDGSLIRLKLPKMSSERRDELIKILHQKLEEARIAIRNVRKEFNNLIRSSQKNKDISEDHARRLTEIMQKITDKYIEMSEKKAEKKENEVKRI